MKRIAQSLGALLLSTTTIALAQQQRQSPTPAQSVAGNFISLNRRIQEMADDFPEDKYGYRPTKDSRSFQEVMVHIISGNLYAAKAGRGEKVGWDELDPKTYKTKAETIAALQKSVADANATLKTVPAEQFAKTLLPWIDVLEHAAEHYGQLVVYYRANGMVPPASRSKGKAN